MLLPGDLDGAAPIRLGLLVDSDAFGGAEVHVRQLLRRLPDSFRCTLVVSEPVAHHFDDLRDRCEEVAVVPLARHRDRAPWLDRLTGACAVDVWQVNLVDPGSNRAALAAATAHRPTVATLHMPGTGQDVTRELRELFGRTAAVVAVSAEIAHTVRARLAVPGERVVQVRNGVDIPPVARPPLRTAGPCRIGAVGRLTPQKGFDVLLEAVADLVARGRDITLDVAGEGRDRAALRAAACGLPVTFHGFVADVPRFLKGVDIFCLPSRAEALSLALLEAMAHARPCVTTPVGDVPEALGDAVVTVPVEDADALARALDDLVLHPARAYALGRLARAIAVAGLDAAGMVSTSAEVLAAARGSRQTGILSRSARGHSSRDRAASRTSSGATP